MAFLKWIPFKDLLFLQERMTRVFDEALSMYSGGPEGLWSPPTDILETDSHIILKVELPGVKMKDINVAVKGQELILAGTKKLAKNLKEEQCHRMESAHGTFRRVFNLTTEVVGGKGKVEATLDNGILEIRLAKATKKSVKVKVAPKAKTKPKTKAKPKAKSKIKEKK
ncbi:MAG: Hsp20/alpha crystallin family protein [Deltaproteobacteria bacterium]|nr:Hsp20/alpha crystallin family protein [Deltaproteobacteria bacterium]